MTDDTDRTLFGDADLPVPLLVFATLGGPVAWLMHLSASYVIVATACASDWRGTTAALIAVTLLSAALAVAAGIAALHGRRRLDGERGPSAGVERPHDRARFFMRIGIIGAGIFLLLILLNGLSPFFVPACP
jgi:hypothetical protein